MSEVRLEEYDWIVVNSSAGKDSQAMLDFVTESARKKGVLCRVVVAHADLSEEEWPGTKELAEEQARHYGVRFEVVRRKQGGILQHVLDRHEKLKADGKDAPPWPSGPNRWCTSDHKRGQISRLLTMLVKELRDGGVRERVRILNCMGMRSAESSAREKLSPFKHDENNSNGRREVDLWLPIFDWSLEQVWQRVRASGARHHPAYDLGMGRLSCCFCIYAPKPALMLAGKHNRALLDRYCEVEEKVGYTFVDGLSLRSVRDALDRGEEPGPVKSWEMP